MLKNIKGVGTIVWGTGNILPSGNTALAGSIVESIQLTPKNGEPIEIEDNDGFTAFEVLLRDGFNGKVSVLYDDTKWYPIEGANVALKIPYAGAGNAAIPFGEGNGAVFTAGANGVPNTVTYTCLIASMSPSYTKKKEATLDFSLTYRPGVAV